MESRLQSQSARMSVYSNPRLITQALECIPLSELEQVAKKGGTQSKSRHTKWLDFAKSSIIMEFHRSVVIDSFALMTANDFPERDPVRFLVEGLTETGAWICVHDQTQRDFDMPLGRHTRSQIVPCNLGHTAIGVESNLSTRSSPRISAVRFRSFETRARSSDCVQLEEIQLLHAGVSMLPAIVKNPDGRSPVGEGPDNLAASLPSPTREPTCEAEYRMVLLKELLRWFKHEFFSWVDALACTQCSGESEVIGMLTPTDDDLLWGAHRVEAHRCKQCGYTQRFPRYNNPAKLLQTRRGRCGEYANCFTLCCAALKFDTRYVLDFTDHVWVEAYCDQLKRYVHLDPCENAFNTPLMYERGWGKKLSYVFAFSLDGHIVDATWRYSKNVESTTSRRTECREEELVKLVARLNHRLQLNPERQAELSCRFITELVEFIAESPLIQNIDYEGRTTGSLQWRQARGELG